MVVKLQKPILVGACGLFSLWLLELVSHWLIHPRAGATGMLGIGIVTVGVSLWLRPKQSTALEIQPEELSTEAVKQVLAQTEQIVEQLEAETANSTSQNQLRSQLTQVTASLERGDIHLAVTGGQAVGKTSLIQVLESNWIPQLQQSCSLTETFSLFTSHQEGVAQEKVARQTALSADLVLFLSQGDLTQLEYQILSDLALQKKRTILVFNKQDQYLPTQQSTILQQLRSRLRDKIAASDIVAIAAHPSSIKVRRHQAGGSVQEWTEQPQPQVQSLTERLKQILAQEAGQLVLQTTMHQALALKAEAQGVLNQARRDLALPLIEQFQWVAAATAFANPFPTLDLLAAAAISSKMVLDLGKLYQQKFSLDQAQAIAGTLASLMLKFGLVEFTTQTLGSLLKSNSITFVAGGAVQGVSAAYLTRLAGLSLIEHFQMHEQSDTSTANSKLAETLQAVFRQNQRVAFLKSLIQQTLDRLRSQSGEQAETSLPQFSSNLEPLKISGSQAEPLKIPELQTGEFVSAAALPIMPEAVQKLESPPLSA